MSEKSALDDGCGYCTEGIIDGCSITQLSDSHLL